MSARMDVTEEELAEAISGADSRRQAGDDALQAAIDAIPGGGGGGAVDSVNGQTGVVVLDADDVGADPAGSAASEATARAGADSAHAALTRADDVHGIGAELDAIETTLDQKASNSDLESEILARQDAVDQEATDRQAAIDAAVATLLGNAPQASLDTLRELGDAIAAGETSLQNLINGKQPLSATLTALAATSPTTFGKSVLEWANAAAGIAALGLGTAATHAATDFDSSGAAATAQTAAQAYADGADALLIPKSIGDNAGDLIGFSADNTPVKIPKASADGKVLRSKSAGTGGVEWADGGGIGLLAARPAANSVPAGWSYFATDDNGGTLYMWDGSAWKRVSPLARLLGQATRSSNFDSTTAGTEYDVTGVSKAVTVEDKPVRARFTCPWGVKTNAAGGIALITLYRDTTSIAKTSWKSTASGDSSPGLTMIAPAEVLTAGSYTYKVTLVGGWFSSGVSTLVADANSKMTLSIEEVPAIG